MVVFGLYHSITILILLGSVEIPSVETICHINVIRSNHNSYLENLTYNCLIYLKARVTNLGCSPLFLVILCLMISKLKVLPNAFEYDLGGLSLISTSFAIFDLNPLIKIFILPLSVLATPKAYQANALSSVENSLIVMCSYPILRYSCA